MKNKGFFFLMSLIIVSLFGACSDDDSTYDTSGYTDALVSGFQLPDNDDYAENLSDVYFTINQYGKVLSGNKLTGDNLVGEIFNADSLPVGTITNSLLAKITFADASKVTLYTATDTVEYSSTYSINFSKPVLMEVLAGNGINKKFYEIKVNVHTQVPDSLHWASFVNDPLADAGTITSQKVVEMNSNLYWLIQNQTGASFIYTASTSDLKQWSKQPVSGLNGADILSLCIFRSNLYVVTATGSLLKSADGANWSEVGATPSFVNLISSYGVNESNSQLIAIVQNGGKYYFSYSLNAIDWVQGDTLETSFPVRGFSNPVEYTSGNASAPFQMLTLVGGKRADGTLSNQAWSYDGMNPWFEYQPTDLPPMQGGSIVSYETDPRTRDTFWMMLGGQLSDKTYSNTIYVSYNKGIGWVKASKSYAYPASYAARAFSSVYVDANYFINLMGGENASGELNQIWRGRLNQLAFTPVE